MDSCVEIRVVYEWTCDDCGRDNLERSPPPEAFLTPEDIRELREEYGLQPDEMDQITLEPLNVTCRYCNTNFGVCQ